MKSKWNVTTQKIGDTRKYAVYRLRDIHATQHSGNMEMGTLYHDSRALAQFVADLMNQLTTSCGALWSNTTILIYDNDGKPLISCPIPEEMMTP